MGRLQYRVIIIQLISVEFLEFYKFFKRIFSHLFNLNREALYSRREEISVLVIRPHNSENLWQQRVFIMCNKKQKLP